MPPTLGERMAGLPRLATATCLMYVTSASTLNVTTGMHLAL
jgi:hypothetical protein